MDRRTRTYQSLILAGGGEVLADGIPTEALDEGLVSLQAHEGAEGSLALRQTRRDSPYVDGGVQAEGRREGGREGGGEGGRERLCLAACS